MAFFNKKDKEPEKPAAAAAVAPKSGATPPTTATPSAPVDPEVLKKGEAESQHTLFALGQIVTILMNAPQFQNATLENIKALIVPAVMSGQFMVAVVQSTQTGHFTPVGVALWASVSDEVDKRLAQDLDKPFNLAADEWRSGSNAWLVLSAGEEGAVNAMLANMQKTGLQGRGLKLRVTGADGKISVHAFSPPAAA